MSGRPGRYYGKEVASWKILLLRASKNLLGSLWTGGSRRIPVRLKLLLMKVTIKATLDMELTQTVPIVLPQLQWSDPTAWLWNYQTIFWISVLRTAAGGVSCLMMLVSVELWLPVDLHKGIDGLSRIIGGQSPSESFLKGNFISLLWQMLRPHQGTSMDGGRFLSVLQAAGGRLSVLVEDQRRRRRPYRGTDPAPWKPFYFFKSMIITPLYRQGQNDENCMTAGSQFFVFSGIWKTV